MLHATRFGLPQAGGDRMAAQGAQQHGRHEVRGSVGHGHPDLDAAAAQLGDHVAGLEGRHAAADADHNPARRFAH